MTNQRQAKVIHENPTSVPSQGTKLNFSSSSSSSSLSSTTGPTHFSTEHQPNLVASSMASPSSTNISESSETSNSLAITVGASLGAVFIVLVIFSIILVFVLFRKRKQAQKLQIQDKEQQQQQQQQQEEGEQVKTIISSTDMSINNSSTYFRDVEVVGEKNHSLLKPKNATQNDLQTTFLPETAKNATLCETSTNVTRCYNNNNSNNYNSSNSNSNNNNNIHSNESTTENSNHMTGATHKTLSFSNDSIVSTKSASVSLSLYFNTTNPTNNIIITTSNATTSTTKATDMTPNAINEAERQLLLHRNIAQLWFSISQTPKRIPEIKTNYNMSNQRNSNNPTQNMNNIHSNSTTTMTTTTTTTTTTKNNYHMSNNKNNLSNISKFQTSLLSETAEFTPYQLLDGDEVLPNSFSRYQQRLHHVHQRRNNNANTIAKKRPISGTTAQLTLSSHKNTNKNANKNNTNNNNKNIDNSHKNSIDKNTSTSNNINNNNINNSKNRIKNNKNKIGNSLETIHESVLLQTSTQPLISPVKRSPNNFALQTLPYQYTRRRLSPLETIKEVGENLHRFNDTTMV